MDNSTLAKKPLVIGQSQQAPCPLNKTAAIEHLTLTAKQAAAWGVQLLVLPEMSLSGYNLTLEEIKRIAEPHNGELFDAVATICQQLNIAVVYGYAEVDDNQRLFNSIQLIDSDGKARLHYRKTHLWGELDRGLFTAGDVLSSVVELHGWQIAAAICYDVEFPETVRSLALAGAEVIVVPTGLMSPWTFVAQNIVPVRAAENGVFIAYTNYCGNERDIAYVGNSTTVDPTGAVLARALEQPVLLTATLNPQTLVDARSKLPYLNDRRPELYLEQK